jgi:DNA-3-methyladenine glycosylase II
MPDTRYFAYGEKEIAWLKSRDPILGAAMDTIGHIRRAVIPDLFMALVNAIVGQQISTKAQVTIWQRMQARCTPMTPEVIGALSAEELQSCGISFRKAFYIKEIADSILCGELDLNHLRSLPDADLCKRLSQIRGIGVWTAEMLMTFSLQRPDVMSWDDLAILRGMRMLYRHRKISRALFAKYKRRYAPYATVASLYLWAIAGGACPLLVDHAPRTEAQKKMAARKRKQPIVGKP